MTNSFKSPMQKAIVGWLAAHPDTSQRELAKLADIDSGDLSRLARGEKGSLNAEPALRLAGAMGVTVEELLAGQAEGKTPANVQSIPLDLIDPSPHNPRQSLDETELQGLADSIRESGLLQPLVVMRAVGGKRFELIAGHRRLCALQMIEAGTALCLIRSDGTTTTARALQIIENLQRADIAPMDEARALSDLQAENPTRFTAAEIGRLIGKSDRFVAQRIAIARTLAPELQDKLTKGEIGIEVARSLAAAPAKLQKEIAKDPWALRDAETVRSRMYAKAIPLSAAAFKVELYDGEYLEDGDKKWFADAAKFNRLQKTAAQARVEKLQKEWPNAALVSRNDLHKYVWADDGGLISTYGDKTKAEKRRKGLAADDCTALVFLDDHKIKTLRNVVLGETYEAKTEKPKPAERAEMSQQRASEGQKEVQALNEKVADGLAQRPDLARRLMIYAFLGNVDGMEVHGDVVSRIDPWSELLADFVASDSDHYFDAYDPPNGAEDKLWALLRGVDDATIDAMLGRLASLTVNLHEYGHARGVTRAITGELGVDLPARLIPKPIEEEPVEQAAALEGAPA